MKMRTVLISGAVLTIVGIVMVVGPGTGEDRHRSSHWHWHWSWPSVSSSLLLPPVSVLLSATVLLCPVSVQVCTVSVWVCGFRPSVRATNRRLRPAGSGTSAILLSAVVGIAAASRRATTANTSAILLADSRHRSTTASTGTSRHRTDSTATTPGTAGGRPYAGADSGSA